MSNSEQVDNSTIDYKSMIRKETISMLNIATNCVMETHGGIGEIYKRCYTAIESGIVFEKDDNKVSVLASQRPSWRVYQADCIGAIKSGVGGDMPITLLDVDPYGGCWETISAFFTSNRYFTNKMAVVVNDGLRQKLNIGAWDVAVLDDIVKKYGNKIHGIYLEVCRELLDEYVDIAGYSVSHFSGYYTGYNNNMTHFMAILDKR